jgi:hypothetical protein
MVEWMCTSALLDLCATWRYFPIHAFPLYHKEKRNLYSVYRRLDRPQSGFGCYEERKSLILLSIEP